MKKSIFVGAMFFSVFFLAACAGGDNSTKNTGAETKTTTKTVVEEKSGPVAFADVGEDIMDAMDTYKLFRFTAGEGSCMEKGFPTNLVYAAPNMIKTEDEKYFENMTMVDFTGRISFDELPLGDKKVACEVNTTMGLTTAKVTCFTGENADKKEECTASFKLYGEKK